MIYGCFFILGLVLGLGIHILLRAFIGVDGVFIIDDGDFETTRWTLQMKTNPTEISHKKHVYMTVKMKGD